MMADKTMREEIADILVDCYSDEEEEAAWEVAFQDSVVTPFDAALLCIPVRVTGFRAGTRNCMQCQIVRDRKKRWMGVEDLDEEALPDDFRHVLDLYRAWGSGKY
jgi:hypothetical protein